LGLRSRKEARKKAVSLSLMLVSLSLMLM